MPLGETITDIRDDANTANEMVPEDDWEETSDLHQIDGRSGAASSDLPSGKETISSKKAQRAERKLARNQARFDIITTEDISKVEAALHPYQGNDLTRGSLDPLADSTIEANISFTPGTFKFSCLRQDVHTKKLLKNNGPPKTDESETTEKEAFDMAIVFERLGINTNVLHNTRERKSMLTKLHEAIRNYLECVANEDRDTMMRMAGLVNIKHLRLNHALLTPSFIQVLALC